MKKSIFTALLFVVGWCGCYAQTTDSEYEKEMNRMIQLQGQTDVYGETLRLQMNALVERGQLSEDKVDKMCKELSDYITPMLIAGQKELIQKNYTLEELKQLNAFLASPIGQKNLRLSASFAGEGTKIVSSPEVQEKMQAIIMKYMFE